MPRPSKAKEVLGIILGLGEGKRTWLFFVILFHISLKLNGWDNTQIGMSFSYPGDIIVYNNVTYISFSTSLKTPTLCSASSRERIFLPQGK